MNSTFSKIFVPKDVWPKRYVHNMDGFSAGLWNENEGGGRFFMANRKPISVEKKLDDLQKAGVDFIEAHDTDILSLISLNGYPSAWTENQKMDAMRRSATEFRKLLDHKGLKSGMFTMNLFSSETAWNYGNFGSEIDGVRQLAIDRTLAGIDVAIDILGSQVYVYWVGTNGTDGMYSAFHPNRIARTREALIEIVERAQAAHGSSMLPFAIEPKPEEPKFKMYLGTTGDALAMIWWIASQRPELARVMGLNIEAAHSLMGKADPAIDYGYALAQGKLFHIHENGQGEPAYDRDLASGDDGLSGLVDRMWQLVRGGYNGLLGIDVQPLPGDRDDQAAESVARSVRNMKWAIERARALNWNIMEELQGAHNQSGVLAYVQKEVFGIN